MPTPRKQTFPIAGGELEIESRIGGQDMARAKYISGDPGFVSHDGTLPAALDNLERQLRYAADDIRRVRDQELLALARAELFRPFGLLTQRRKMVFATIDHPRNERGEWRCLAPVADWTTVIHDTNDLVDWSTTAQPELTSDEWQVLLRVQQAAMEIERHPWMRYSGPEVVGVQVREHKGVCKRCQKAASERSALVSIEWAGRVLSREYVL